MRESTVAASLLIDVVGYLERQGVERAELLRLLAITPTKLYDAQARLPGSVMERLWVVGEQLTGDPDLGLHTAESHNPGALSVFGYLLWSCQTCRDALGRLARYAAFLNNGLRVRVSDEEGGRTVCRFEAEPGLDNYIERSPRQVMEAMATGTVIALRRLSPSPVEPVGISFRHAAPESIREQLRVFGAGLRFGQNETSIVYASRDLGAILLSANAALLSVLEGQLQRMLAGFEANGPVSQRVAAVLARRMGDAPSLNDVASELAMSVRTLQRELQANGVSYRKLIEDVKRDIAVQHLALPGVSVTEVSFMLGFSEPGAFTRAFRRWTGSAPTAYRATV
jgi:AraC-like DNA-binding protein